jgi:transcriptional regulator with XRE-family HTH domain
MLDLVEIKKRLVGCNFAEVARSIGVTRSYVQQVAKIERLTPSYETVKKLSDYFEALDELENEREAG